MSTPSLNPVPDGLNLVVPFGSTVEQALEQRGFDPTSLGEGEAPATQSRPAKADVDNLIEECQGLIELARERLVGKDGKLKTDARMSDVKSVMASMSTLMNSLIRAEKAIDHRREAQVLENGFVSALQTLDEPHRTQAFEVFEAYVQEHGA